MRSILCYDGCIRIVVTVTTISNMRIKQVQLVRVTFNRCDRENASDHDFVILCTFDNQELFL